MLKGYYYENYGDHVNQEFSLWHLDNEYAKLMMFYKNDFGILSLEKEHLTSCYIKGIDYLIEEGIGDEKAGEFPEGLAKKILEQDSAKEVKVILDDFFKR